MSVISFPRCRGCWERGLRSTGIGPLWSWRPTPIGWRSSSTPAEAGFGLPSRMILNQSEGQLRLSSLYEGFRHKVPDESRIHFAELFSTASISGRSPLSVTRAIACNCRMPPGNPPMRQMMQTRQIVVASPQDFRFGELPRPRLQQS
jgi:hypothetical protein